MLQSPQLVRHCACAIRHETLIKFIIIIYYYYYAVPRRAFFHECSRRPHVWSKLLVFKIGFV